MGFKRRISEFGLGLLEREENAGTEVQSSVFSVGR